MKRVADSIREETGGTIAVTSSEEDAFLADDPDWKALITGIGVKRYHGRSLREVCEKLGGARLFVGNDSGVSHLAAGLGIPCVVFFSITDPAQWAPWTLTESLKIIDLRGNSGEPDIKDILRWVRCLPERRIPFHCQTGNCGG